MANILKTIGIVGAVIFGLAIIIVSVLSYANTAAPWDVKSANGNTPAAAGSGSGVATVSGGVQAVTLSMKDYQYVLDPPTLIKDVPVRMTVDNSVQGCARDVVIPDFGVRKYVTSTDNVITFTPTKAGVFPIHCSMNMYQGQFQVTSDGTPDPSAKLAAPSPTQPSGGSCSAGGGGCGCGMMRRT